MHFPLCLAEDGGIDRAKAWYASAAQNEINAIRIKSTKSRAFIVDGAIP
jgi:uncharacterized protein (DUF1330 family)